MIDPGGCTIVARGGREGQSHKTALTFEATVGAASVEDVENCEMAGIACGCVRVDRTIFAGSLLLGVPSAHQI
jgi:hypothetical protein